MESLFYSSLGGDLPNNTCAENLRDSSLVWALLYRGDGLWTIGVTLVFLGGNEGRPGIGVGSR
jgi:hypothetical protein